MITPLPASIFPNKLAPTEPRSMSRNSWFCSFYLFSIAWLAPFNKIPESLISQFSFYLSFLHFRLSNIVVSKNFLEWRVSDQKIFFWIPPPATNVAGTFLANVKPVLIMVQAICLETHPILDICVFYNFALTEKLSAKWHHG